MVNGRVCVGSAYIYHPGSSVHYNGRDYTIDYNLISDTAVHVVLRGMTLPVNVKLLTLNQTVLYTNSDILK